MSDTPFPNSPDDDEEDDDNSRPNNSKNDLSDEVVSNELHNSMIDFVTKKRTRPIEYQFKLCKTVKVNNQDQN